MSELFMEAGCENFVIDLFQNMDYNYVYGSDVERVFRSPLYENEQIDVFYFSACFHS